MAARPADTSRETSVGATEEPSRPRPPRAYADSLRGACGVARPHVCAALPQRNPRPSEPRFGAIIILGMLVYSEGAARLSWLRRLAMSKWLRLGITAALLGLVGSQLDWHAVVDRIRHGNFEYVLLAIAFLALALVVGAYRWHRLLLATGSAETSELARVYGVFDLLRDVPSGNCWRRVMRVLLVGKRGIHVRPRNDHRAGRSSRGLDWAARLAWIGIALNRRTCLGVRSVPCMGNSRALEEGSLGCAGHRWQLGNCSTPRSAADATLWLSPHVTRFEPTCASRSFLSCSVFRACVPDSRRRAGDGAGASYRRALGVRHGGRRSLRW